MQRYHPRDRNRSRRLGLAPCVIEKIVEELLVQQDGACAICGDDHTEDKPLSLDHNHQTGAIRGLTCGKCNRGLGLFNDSFCLLEKAAEYLKRHES